MPDQPSATCAACSEPLDLAEPHVTLLQQLEREQHGVVAVLDSHTVEYRHRTCPRGDCSGADHG